MLDNAIVTRNGNKLNIEVDLSKKLGPSASGKSTLIAKGADKLGDGIGLTLSVYQSKPKN